MLEAQQWVGNGRYQLVRFLRAGGAGVVWEARDRRPRPGESAAVAIKVLDAAAGGAAAAEREAEGAARVQHPNVVRVRDTFTEDGLAFMVMELAVGSLADLVAREGPFPPPIALGCALQACEALAAAHRAGVVHRDVKPHNLLVFADGSVRLADFGAARALMDGHTRTRTGALLGSIPFMAPEQRRDARAVQPATDVYALAVTLGWLLLGEAPEEPWTEEAAAQLRSVRAPEGLVHAFAAAGARRPEDRPANGAALLEVLRGCGVVPAPVPMPEGWEGVREEAPIATARAAAGRGSRWTLGVVGAGVLGVAGVLGLGALSPAMLEWGAGSNKRSTQTPADEKATNGIQDDAAIKNVIPPCLDAPREWVERVERGPRESVDADIADVDSDGKPDVLFANTYDESVSVWWGEASSLPTVRTDIKVGRQVRAPAVGDVNGDKVNDLVIPLYNESAVGIVYGLGKRQFGKPIQVFQDPSPFDLALADLNNDGHPELSIESRQAVTSIFIRPGVSSVKHFGSQVKAITEQEQALRVLTSAKQMTAWVTGVGHVARVDMLSNGMTGVVKEIDAPGQVIDIARDGSHEDSVILTVAGVGENEYRRQPTDGSAPCLIGRRRADRSASAFGDLDQDGVIDLVETRTCQYCESNHVFVRGIR